VLPIFLTEYLLENPSLSKYGLRASSSSLKEKILLYIKSDGRMSS
jgi:hypothetical protein